MSFIAGGFLSGLGEGLMEVARQRREDAVRQMGWDREDAQRAEAAAARSSGGGGGGGGGGGSSAASSRPRPLSRGMTGDIMDWAENNGLDAATTSAFVTETERLLGADPNLTENQAWSMVLNGAQRGDREVTAGEGWFDGPRRTEVLPGEGNFNGTFQYDDPRFAGFGAALGEEAPARPAAPPQVMDSAPVMGAPAQPPQPATPQGSQVRRQESNAGGLPQPRTEAEYRALPPGTRYIDPEGKTRIKPA